MRFFDWLLRHCQLSYWLTWLYVALCLIGVEFLPDTWQSTALGLLILPANAVAWPIAFEVLGNGKWKSAHPRVQSAFITQPMATAFLPVYCLFFLG